MLSGDGWLQIGARSSVSTMLIRLWLTITLWILPYMNYVMQKKVQYKMSGRGQEVDDPLIYLSLWPSDAIWWHRSGHWQHQAITLILSVKSCGIHLRAISLEMLEVSIFQVCCKTAHQKLLPYLKSLTTYFFFIISEFIFWQHYCSMTSVSSNPNALHPYFFLSKTH